MNEKNLKLSEPIIGKNYVELAANALSSNSNKIKNLLAQRRLPDTPWSSLEIDAFLNNIALMDSNNYEGKITVGEREARIFSSKVQQRNHYTGHGIGRSGDIDAVQPKAPGSSLLAKLTHYLTKDAMELAGYQCIKSILLLPLATGMALTMCLLVLKGKNPKATYVIWPRIDQRTCQKCISTAGLTPLVVEPLVEGKSVVTNEKRILELIEEYGQENILCVLSTTSCFAPREPDRVEAIAEICKEKKIGHIINNAYGVQCTKIANSINQAVKIGGVDFIVQSTDKNFMVPVGGSVVFSGDKSRMKDLNSSYPGRASNSPIIDLFITFLEMGKSGWLNLLKERKNTYAEFSQTLKEFAEKYGEEAIILPGNKISMGLTIKGYLTDDAKKIESKDEKIMENSDATEFNPTATDYTKLGGILFKKRVTGAKVVCENQKGKMVCGYEFKNYGCGSDSYPHLPYITMAASIGGTKKELEDFLDKIRPYLKSVIPEEKPAKDGKGEKNKKSTAKPKTKKANKPQATPEIPCESSKPNPQPEEAKPE